MNRVQEFIAGTKGVQRVLIDNDPFFDAAVRKVCESFVQVAFIISHPVDWEYPKNLFDLDKIGNGIELSEHCDVLVGRNTGAHADWNQANLMNGMSSLIFTPDREVSKVADGALLQTWWCPQSTPEDMALALEATLDQVLSLVDSIMKSERN